MDSTLGVYFEAKTCSDEESFIISTQGKDYTQY